MDRLHSIADAIAAKQQARADLVDRGAQDRRLHRGPRPVILTRRAAAQPTSNQRRLVGAREPAKRLAADRFSTRREYRSIRRVLTVL